MRTHNEIFRTERPYGAIINPHNLTYKFFNRHYKPLGFTEGYDLIQTWELDKEIRNEACLSQLSDIFQDVHTRENGILYCFFYNDATNPHYQSEPEAFKRMMAIYNDRVMKFDNNIRSYY